MTELNKKNFEMISSLRNKFLKLRILTEEEEFTGKLKIFFISPFTILHLYFIGTFFYLLY